MSDIRDVRTDLQRRRELATMSKPDLITHTLWCETRIIELTNMLQAAAEGRAPWRNK